MAVLLVKAGAYSLNAKHLQKKGNVWYFRRRVPQDVRSAYPDRPVCLFFSLKTADPHVAARAANQHACEQDALWQTVRSGEPVSTPEARSAAMGILEAFGLEIGQSKVYDKYDLEPSDFLMELSNRSGGEDGRIIVEALPPQHRIAADMFYGRKQTPTFCEVRDKHLALGKGPRGKQGIGQFNNALKLFLGLCGDIPIDQYSRESAHKFIGALVQRKVLHTTIERYVAQIAPIFGTGLREFELPGRNIFEKISIPNKDIVGVKRTSFELGKLRAIQVRCREVDDERRWLLSMLSDTGARLAEIAGLRLADIRLTDPVPHIVLEFTDERRLKQNASIRKVPLLGEALWAAQRIMQNAKGSMAFPSYNKSGSTNAASASAALNKWLRDQGLIIGKSEVIHSFRHTMRDRLRDAGVPEQVCDRLGGWAVGSVGEGYGAGYSIAVLRDWMQRAVPIAE